VVREEGQPGHEIVIYGMEDTGGNRVGWVLVWPLSAGDNVFIGRGSKVIKS
jgi:hypothetical protein